MNNEEKRGIIKKSCNFMKNHVNEIIVGAVGLLASICMVKSTKNTIAKQDEIAEMNKKEHEERMQLYEKAKYTDNTNISINI